MNNHSQSTEQIKYSDLFDLAPVGYFILEREGLIVNVNLAGVAVLGADRQALIKRNFSDHVSTESRDKYNLHLEQVLGTRATQKCELTLRREDGTEFYAQMISTVIADERQRPDKMLSAVLDITDRKRVEEGLRVSQDRYRDLVEATTDWVWEVDAEGTYTYASPKVQELLGYGVDEVLGRTPFDLMPEEEATRVRAFFEERRDKGESFYGLENTNRHKDGHLVVLETNGIPIFDAEGRLSGYRGIDRDITDRKNAEQQIRHQKEFFETAIDSLTHPFYVIDVSDYTIKMANRAANFGDLGEGLKCYTITHRRDEPCSGLHVCPLEKVKDTRQPMTVEHVHYDKDGKSRIVEVHAFPVLDAKGDVTLVIEYCLDITERKRAEEALRQAHDELEARVARRTAELKEANEELTVEIAERKRAETETQERNKFLNNVLESLTHPFYVVDANSYVIKIANSAALRQFGGKLSRETTCHELVHMRKEPCYACDWPCPIEEIRRTGRPAVVEHIHRDENGNPRNVEVHAYPILDEKGNLSEVIEYSLDITERKQAEKELAQKQKNLEALCRAAPVGIMVLNKDLIIEQVNPVIAGLVGKDSSAMVAKLPGEALNCIHAYDGMELCGEGPLCHLCQIRGTVERVLTSAEAVSGIETQATFVIDGEEVSRWLEISAAPVIIDDSKHVVLAVNDITERKESQAKLEAAQHRLLETAHRAGMAEVATDVLHNVGNVLNSITVSAITLIEKITSSEAANLERVANLINDNIADIGTFLTEDSQGRHIPAYLGEIARHLQSEQTDTVDRLRALADNVEYIRDIVTTQQSYAKAYGVEMKVSLAELVEDAIQINSAGFERHAIQVIRDFEEISDILTDKQKVLQILVNLISNAKYALIDGAKEKKTLTISIHKRDEDHALVEVVDDGIGISKSNLTKIFSHGYSTRRHGHGFGLHSSALAAKGLGGTLTVHSDGVGRGATFTLGLPVKHVRFVK